MTSEDDLSIGDIKYRGQGFEKGSTDCLAVVLFTRCADAVAWKFGYEEGDFVD